MYPGTGGTFGLAVAPDHGLAAEYQPDAGIRVWEIDSGRRVHDLKNIGFGSRYSLSFSHSGKQLAGMANSLHVIDISGEQKLRWVQVHDNFQTCPRSMVWSPDDTQIWQATHENKFMAFTVSDLKPDSTHPLNALDVSCLRLSPDRKLLMAAMTSGEVRVYDVADWTVAHSWKTDGPVSACAWSPDQTRVGLTVGSQVEIWDVPQQQRQHTALNGGLLEWTADGKQLISVAGATAWQINFESGETKQMAWSSAHASAFSETCVSPDGKLFSTNGSGYDTLFDAESGSQLWNRKQSRHAEHARFGPGNQEMAIDGRGAGAEIRRVSDWQTRLQVEGYRPELTSDGLRILVQLGDGKFAIRSTKDGSLIQEFAVPTGESVFGCWSPDDRLVAVRIGNSQTNSALHIWDTQEGKLRSQIDFPPTPTKDVREVLPVWKNTELLLVPFGGSVYDVSADDLSDWEIWPTKSLRIHALAFSPKSNRALLLDNGTVWLTDENGQAKQTYRKPWSGRLFALPDGRRFASSLFHFYDFPAHGFDAETQQDLGCCFSLLTNGGWLTIGPTGHYQGSEGVESEFLYVAEHLDGHQQTYTPAEFAKAFNWKNDPKQATFLKLVETTRVRPSSEATPQRAELSGISSGSLAFHQQNDRMDVPTLGLDFSQPWTVEAWLQLDAGYNDEMRVIAKCGPVFLTAYRGVWQLLATHTNSDGVGKWGVAMNGPEINNQPIHIAGQWNGKDLQFFLDGQLIHSDLVRWGTEDTSQQILTRLMTQSANQYLVIGNVEFDKRLPLYGQVASLRVSSNVKYKNSFVPNILDKDADTIALYDFSQGSGDMLKDVSGNGHDGKIVGATWVKGEVIRNQSVSSAALDFNGVDAYVSIPRLPLDAGPITVDTILDSRHLSKAGISRMFALDQGDGDKRVKRHILYQPYPDGTATLSLDAVNGTTTTVMQLLKVPFGRMRLTTLWDGPVLECYINGVRQKLTSYRIDTPKRTSEEYVCLGAGRVEEREGLGYFWPGTIDEFKVSVGLHPPGQTGIPTSLENDGNTIALYDFSQGSGDVLKDISGNGHDGKIHGATWIDGQGMPLDQVQQ